MARKLYVAWESAIAKAKKPDLGAVQKSMRTDHRLTRSEFTALNTKILRKAGKR
jgi:hypothetical protein